MRGGGVVGIGAGGLGAGGLRGAVGPLGLALAAGALLVAGPRPIAIALVWLALATPPLIAVDLAEHRLPDAIVLPGYPVVALAVLGEAVADPSAGLQAAGAASAAWLGFLVLHHAGGLGLGDVKLAPLLAAATAVFGLHVALLALVLAFAAGGMVAGWLLIRRDGRRELAFGPHLLLGTWGALALVAA